MKMDHGSFPKVDHSQKLCLGKNIGQSKEEELYVFHPSELCSKGFDFGIERFSSSVVSSLGIEFTFILPP